MIINPYETGNSIEQNLASFLREYFPEYEEYRSKFLVPLTGYPRDKNWRRDTHPELERIGVSSFGLLKSLNFIIIKKGSINVSAHPDQNFKNIYFHFGLAAECVNTIFRSIVVLESFLKIIDLNKKLRIPNEELIEKFSEWVEKEYPKCFDDMINDGKPIFYYPQFDHGFIKLIIKDKQTRSNYLQVVKELKDYRNFFIHNPGIDVFKDSFGLHAIKKEEVRKSKNWASLRYLYSIDKTLFIDPQEMVNEDLMKFTKNLNIIWPLLIGVLINIYSHTNFPNIFKRYNRKTF